MRSECFEYKANTWEWTLMSAKHRLKQMSLARILICGGGGLAGASPKKGKASKAKSAKVKPSPMTPAPVTFITGNANKLAEVQAILTGVSLTSLSHDLPEIQHGSLAAIVADKAKTACGHVNGPVLVEDTALCFHALGGMPGPYVKWFLDSAGNDGLVRMLADYDDKRADAVCTFAYAAPGVTPVCFEGRVSGVVVKARGPASFGWDAIFQPDGVQQTYAEMTTTCKNEISHRARALDKVRAYLTSRDTPS